MNFNGLGVLNAAMLIGLAGAAIPIVIHLLNRRNDPVVDWGAMQFLEFSPRERRRLNIDELLLMLARMGLLAMVAFALARPFWSPRALDAGASSSSAAPAGDSGVRRDVVIVLDGSSRMGRQAGGTTPRSRAIAWARGFVRRLGPGDSVAVLEAGDRVRSLVDPPSFDLPRVDKALAEAPARRGSSDLPSAIGEAFRILEKTGNPARDVVVLSDARRSSWMPGDLPRWSLLRELRRRMPVPPRVWAPTFAVLDGGDGPPDGSVGPLELSRAVLTPRLPVEVTASIANAGPGPMTRRRRPGRRRRGRARLEPIGRAGPRRGQDPGDVPDRVRPGRQPPGRRPARARPRPPAPGRRVGPAGLGRLGPGRLAGRRRAGAGTPERRGRLPPGRSGAQRRPVPPGGGLDGVDSRLQGRGPEGEAGGGARQRRPARPRASSRRSARSSKAAAGS